MSKVYHLCTCIACPVVVDTPFPIPVWALVPIILGGLLILGIVSIVIVKIAVVIVVSCPPAMS